MTDFELIFFCIMSDLDQFLHITRSDFQLGKVIIWKTLHIETLSQYIREAYEHKERKGHPQIA